MRITDWSSGVCSSDRLQPARHGDVVGIDPPVALGQFALHVQHVAGAAGAGDDPPEACVGGQRVAVLLGEADERVLARHDQSVRIEVAHGMLSLLRSEEHTSELQSLMRNSYAVFCL